MSREQELEVLVDDLATEGKALVDALNAMTGYDSGNPNPLVKRMLRLTGDAKLIMETEDE